MRTFLRLLLLLALALTGSGAAAQSLDGGYGGGAIRWIVPYRTGGGYDQYARLIAPFLENRTGAAVEIVNMPGGGGMRGAVEIFRSPPDGFHIGMVNGSALVGNEIAATAGANYSLADFSYIARVASEPRVLVARAGSDIVNFEDVLTADREIIVGASGKGGSTYVDAVIMAHVFGYDQKLIDGFDSSADIRLALLRGDVHFMWGSLGSAQHGIRNGDFVPILSSGSGSHPDLDGVPSVTDFSATLAPDRLALLKAWRALIEVGRPMVAAPDTQPERLKTLRTAFRDILADPEFLDAAAQAGREIHYLSAVELEAVITDATTVDDATRAVLAATLDGRP